MQYRSVKGMEDILPEDIRIWQEMERAARIELESNGYKEIRTPVLEETAVFVRSIGETTDIVSKEMFTFEDRGDRSLTMRPEGTAPIVRAYIENSLDQKFSVAQLYYIGPMFRSERPQKGRSRQFHQIGVEIIGSRSPQVDGEAIRRLNKMLGLFGLEGCSIKLNSLGCRQDKMNFAEKLKGYLKDKKNALCEDCNTRLDKNVLRVLDCKNENCIRIVKDAPSVSGSLCPDCAGHFAAVRAMLAPDVKFEEAKNLVRGLDYYTGTVFEVTHPALGGQDALAAGGRYDNLVKEMGGPDMGAVGFAIGMERIIIALGDKAKMIFAEPAIIYIATMGKEAKSEGFKLAEEIKREINKDAFKLITLTDLAESSLKSQMRSADKNGAKLVLILGENELKDGIVALKNMAGDKEQVNVKRESIVEEIRKRLC